MTVRDRLVLMVIAMVAILAAAWLLAVSPARKQASKVEGEVTQTRSQLAQALSEVAEARSAKSHYRSAYASLVSLGQAVPTSPEVPALVYAIDKASDNHKVTFASISAQGSSSSSSQPAPSGSAASTSAGATFKQVPFTFAFTGTYEDLLHLLGQIERFTVQPAGGTLKVSGRLLTIQTITLAPSTQGSSTSGASASGSSHGNSAEQTWTIGASAYVLPPGSTSLAPSTGTTGTPSTGTTGSGGATAATPAVVQASG
jgi:hypothetical protein